MKVKTSMAIFSLLMMCILVGCGTKVEQNEQIEDDGYASGTMLAGQEAPKVDGIIKSIYSTEEVLITVNDKDIMYRLSEEAKIQLEEGKVKSGSEVTFETFSIGDDKESIAEFIIE